MLKRHVMIRSEEKGVERVSEQKESLMRELACRNGGYR